MDQSSEKEPGSIDPSSRDCSSSPDLAANGSLKSCTDCQTTKTPLWRGGPFGPKSLCNACGIRYRKKRREVLGVKERRIGGGGEVGKESSKDGVSEKLRKALAVGSDSWKRRSAAALQKQRRRLGEEEQAAVLLMSLSSGFLYAH